MDSFASKYNSFKSEEFSIELENSLNILSNNISKLDINSCISSETERDVFIDELECEPNKPSLSVSIIKDKSDCNSDSDESFVSALSSPTFMFHFYINGFVFNSFINCLIN